MKAPRTLQTTLLALVVLAGGLFAGCDAFTDGYDVDPNSAEQAPAPLLLTTAEVGTIMVQEADFARVASMWAGQFSGSDRQYSAYNIYNVTSDNFTNLWNQSYQNTLAQLRLVQEKATETSDPALLGIGQTLEALNFGTLTSLFGDIPYSQALQPFEFPDPAFDAQADVYAGLQTTLSEAISNLSGASASGPVAAADIFFGGDTACWAQVAHTLKARFALHTADYQTARSEAQQGINSTACNLVAPHFGAARKNMNIYHLFVVVERDGYLTADNAYGVSLLDPNGSASRGNDKTDETARFANYYADFNGNGVIDPNVSPGGYFAADAGFPIVTFAENQLILAEAILQTGGSQDDALAALNSVREALNQRYDDANTPGVPYEAYELADFASGGIANPNGEAQADALLREILEEKYFALFGTVEVFNDVRRTDNFIGVPPTTGTQLPQRFLYALGELNANDNAPNPIPGTFEATPVNASINYQGVSAP